MPADSPMSVSADPTRDWPEDFAHENGQYQRTCIFCKEDFVGHKRRVTCKKCAEQAIEHALSSAPAADRPLECCPSFHTDGLHSRGCLYTNLMSPAADRPVEKERIYPCDLCSTMRTKAEGGTTFTVCEACWKKLYPPRPVENSELREALKRLTFAANGGIDDASPSNDQDVNTDFASRRIEELFIQVHPAHPAYGYLATKEFVAMMEAEISRLRMLLNIEEEGMPLVRRYTEEYNALKASSLSPEEARVVCHYLDGGRQVRSEEDLATARSANAKLRRISEVG